jgi:glutamate:GABA antiporter
LTVRRAIIYPGIGTADPDASLPSGFAGQRLEYTLSQVIPLAVMILIGLLAAEAEGRIS